MSSSYASVVFEQTPAETNALITPSARQYLGEPWYDVRRVGIVPNDSGAASANTTALQSLLSPTTNGPRGIFVFPNTTGQDIYYFNNRIPCRDHVHIDLGGCTLNFTRTGDATDTRGGCFHFLRHCSLQNGKIVVNYTYTAGTNTFNAIVLAGRGTSSTDFASLYDSLEPEPFGDITLKNLVIDYTYTGASSNQAILMFGGLQNCVFENIRIIGNNTLELGIHYEFGWATDNVLAADRESSHAHNLVFRNIAIEGMTTTGSFGFAIRLGGAYNVIFDGVDIRGAVSGIVVDPAEALFYRPWDPNNEIDLAGYRVYYGESSRTYSQIIDAGTTTSQVLSGLDDVCPGAAHDIQVEIIFGARIHAQVRAHADEDATTLVGGLGGAHLPGDRVAIGRGVAFRHGRQHAQVHAVV